MKSRFDPVELMIPLAGVGVAAVFLAAVCAVKLIVEWVSSR
jgi:hypothetical protein